MFWLITGAMVFGGPLYLLWRWALRSGRPDDTIPPLMMLSIILLVGAFVPMWIGWETDILPPTERTGILLDTKLSPCGHRHSGSSHWTVRWDDGSTEQIEWPSKHWKNLYEGQRFIVYNLHCRDWYFDPWWGRMVSRATYAELAP